MFSLLGIYRDRETKNALKAFVSKRDPQEATETGGNETWENRYFVPSLERLLTTCVRADGRVLCTCGRPCVAELLLIYAHMLIEQS